MERVGILIADFMLHGLKEPRKLIDLLLGRGIAFAVVDWVLVSYLFSLLVIIGSFIAIYFMQKRRSGQRISSADLYGKPGAG